MPVVKQVLDELSKPEYRNQATTVAHELYIRLWQSGNRIPERDLIHVMKRFAVYGYGYFKTGRRGHHSRIEWKYSPFSLGNTALGPQFVQQDHEPVDYKNGGGDTVEESEVAEVSAVDSSVLDHRYRLRQDLVVDLKLPADLTAWEAARLSEFIKTLPFEAPRPHPVNFGDLSMYRPEN